MASLRTAFLQTYQTGHTCFSLLTSLSCLYQLSCDDRPQETTSSITPKMSLASSFAQFDHQLSLSKKMSSWMAETQCSSLVQIADKASSDFGGQDQSSFVHVLEILPELGEETNDLETVISEEITLDDD